MSKPTRDQRKLEARVKKVNNIVRATTSQINHYSDDASEKAMLLALIAMKVWESAGTGRAVHDWFDAIKYQSNRYFQFQHEEIRKRSETQLHATIRTGRKKK